jgi:hypothetical protein
MSKLPKWGKWQGNKSTPTSKLLFELYKINQKLIKLNQDYCALGFPNADSQFAQIQSIILDCRESILNHICNQMLEKYNPPFLDYSHYSDPPYYLEGE